MDWITRFRIVGWFEAYYQPEKLKTKESGFRERYINSLIEDFKVSKRGLKVSSIRVRNKNKIQFIRK